MSRAHGLFPRRAFRARPIGTLGIAPAIVTAIVSAGVIACVTDSAGAQFSPQRQAQCELSAIRDTRSAFAVQTIRSACNWLALNGDSLLNESLRPYYACLVQNLSGAQSDAAAGAIVSACRAANPR